VREHYSFSVLTQKSGSTKSSVTLSSLLKNTQSQQIWSSESFQSC